MTDAIEVIDNTSTTPSLTFPTDLPLSYSSLAASDPSQPRTSFTSQASHIPDVYHSSMTSPTARSNPATPSNNRRRKHADHTLSDTSHSSSTIADLLRTPRKKSIREGLEQASPLLEASSSPTRCSPSKRVSPFSSSSPSRRSTRESVLRPRPDSVRSSRRRARTSSGTQDITQGLACATMHCDSDPYANSMPSDNNIVLPSKTTTRKGLGEESAMSIRISTFQVVKMGLSKYTPLLKPQWLLSEPWKTEATVSKVKATSEPEFVQRGHRRSKASESIASEGFSEVYLHHQSPGSTASFIDSPPLTAKEDVTKLTPANTPEMMVFSPTLLGPAFAEEIEVSDPADLSAGAVRRPVAARATRGRSIQSYRSLTDVAQLPNNRGTLFPKRCRRQPFASPSGITQFPQRSSSVNIAQEDLACSPSNMGGLGIVCVQDSPSMSTSVTLQSPMSSPMDCRRRVDSILSSTPGMESSAYSDCSSSVPSIVVTPPAVFTAHHLQEREHRVQREGVRLEYPDFGSPCNSIMTTPNAFPALLLPSPLQTPSTNSTTLQLTPSPTLPDCTLSPSEEACLLRAQADEQGIATFKIAVDAILSDYFVYRTVTRTWRLAHQLVLLVQSILGPKGSKQIQMKGASNVNKFSSPAPRSHEVPSIIIPSLCGHRWIGEGDTAVKVPIEWGAMKLKSTLKLVMDHVVTGMIALVTDDRAPYETPIALGQLCRSLQEELPTFLDLPDRNPISSKGKHAPESPVTSWVRACASVESPDSLQGSTSFCSLDDICDPNEREWRKILQDTNPNAVFLMSLCSTIQTVYDKGEAIRSRANLLAVPPPRKGSRKKWQAANAEMNAQKALREKEISQVTCGVISVPEFRRRERKRAAVGSIKDNFAAFFFVRFVGELYNSKVLDVITIRQWLQRFFFKTVFPGVPSSYELEAGCALLITVGETLDEQAGTFTPEMKRTGFFSCPNEVEQLTKESQDRECIGVDIEDLSISTPGSATSSYGNNRIDDVPANHWILVSPRAVREKYASGNSHGNLISDDSVPNDSINNNNESTCSKAIAKRTITATMARLKEILAIREVHAESRVWCREVLALRNRFWVQYDTGTSHKVGTTIRKMKRDLWGA